MASPGNRHCANCIGALSFPMVTTEREYEVKSHLSFAVNGQ